MLSKLWKPAIGLAVLGVLVLLVAAGATWLKRRQEANTGTDEQKLARTLEIIRTSTPANHKVLKVLFYGQSITRSGWHNAVVAHWHEKYPNTVFVVENRALGGFASQWLVRTTEQDISAFYPDLIIFHVYGITASMSGSCACFAHSLQRTSFCRRTMVRCCPTLPVQRGCNYHRNICRVAPESYGSISVCGTTKCRFTKSQRSGISMEWRLNRNVPGGATICYNGTPTRKPLS